jgi:hypothetical protein
MTEFTYTTVPGKIKSFLEKIRQVGVPPKAGVQWMRSIGFSSSNDRSLLGVLKTIGLTDGSGVPTSVWSEFRGAQHRRVLGAAIRKGYAELFAVYPDAWLKANADLEHVFATSSNAGKQVIQKTVGTFKALCESADFGPVDERPIVETGPVHTPVAQQAASRAASSGKSPSVHIDIQIHISPEASPEQIDQIFKSMSKHLYGSKETE